MAAHLQEPSIVETLLADEDVSDKASRQERWHAKDIESGKRITEESETILFMEVGKALLCWAALEEMLVGLVHLLLTTSIQKAGVVMYSIINFGAWLGIITEFVPARGTVHSPQAKMG